ncbi:integrase core domain-containing protein [Kribbella sp. NPDC026596]|uniref:integrase core domain-containing protein n=1 Tax=Kribbella sp. NPDC026596 TaxID=3155122 RepID=UPI0033D53EAC
MEIITWLDDHSRYALAVTAHTRITGAIVLTTFRETVAQYGVPVSTLTDNGMVYTTRLSGGKGGRNGLETELRKLNVTQKNSRPNHPTTCGKVERFQQTLKKWLRAQPVQPATLTELQGMLDAFMQYYNQHRPHRSLPHSCTPAVAYTDRPKATPTTDRSTDTHNRVRTDRVDDAGSVTLRMNGRLHHIGLGRTHARTPVMMLVQDLQITVINAATGELIRQLTLDPTRDYQARGLPPGPRPKTHNPEP